MPIGFPEPQPVELDSVEEPRKSELGQEPVPEHRYHIRVIEWKPKRNCCQNHQRSLPIQAHAQWCPLSGSRHFFREPNANSSSEHCGWFNLGWQDALSFFTPPSLWVGESAVWSPELNFFFSSFKKVKKYARKTNSTLELNVTVGAQKDQYSLPCADQVWADT